MTITRVKIRPNKDKQREISQTVTLSGIDFPIRLIGNSREIQIQASDPNIDFYGLIKAEVGT